MVQHPRIPGRRFLHAPGPTTVPEEVLDAMRRQPMDLADPRLDREIARCESGLRQVLRTRNAEIFMAAANGHGAWEAAVVNLLAPGRTALVAATGHFSESWAVQTEALGRRVTRTPWQPGLAIDAAAVEQALREDRTHEIDAVFAVHTDTASGITSDIPALRRAIDAAGHPALLVVDAVASLAAEPLAMDDWGIDAVVGASQKGLMTPPGLGFVAAGPRAIAAALKHDGPRFYWDWRPRRSPLSYRKFCGTPAQSLLFGLSAALDLIEQEGLDNVLARHRLLAGAVHAALDAWAQAGPLRGFAREPTQRSAAVTTVLLPEGVNPDDLRTVARERFQVALAGGLGPLTGKAFRIGHLGDLNPAMILGCLGAVEATLAVLGIACGTQGLPRAIAHLATHAVPPHTT